MNRSFWSEEKLDHIVPSASPAGLYRIVGLIVSYWLDCIVLAAGSYCIVWIGSYRIGWISKHWRLCAGWLLAGWDGWGGWTGWDVGGMGVGRTDISTRQNRSATIGAKTGEPPLDLGMRRAMGSGGWRQLRRCCKDAEYLCRRRRIIQIECT